VRNNKLLTPLKMEKKCKFAQQNTIEIRPFDFSFRFAEHDVKLEFHGFSRVDVDVAETGEHNRLLPGYTSQSPIVYTA